MNETILIICAVVLTLSVVVLVTFVMFALRRVGRTLEKVDNALARLDTLVAETSSTMIEVRAMVVSLETVAVRAKDIVSGVGQISQRAVGMSGALLDTIDGVARKADAIVRGSRVVAEVLKRRLALPLWRVLEPSSYSNAVANKGGNGHVRQSE